MEHYTTLINIASKLLIDQKLTETFGLQKVVTAGFQEVSTPALAVLAIIFASLIVFFFAVAAGKVPAGCAVVAFFVSFIFVIVALVVVFKKGSVMLAAFIVATILSTIVVVLGKGTGTLIGRSFIDSLFNPKDNRKTEKEYSIVKSYVQLGKYDQAIEQYKKALEENPHDTKVLWELATISAYNLKDYNSAVECIEKIITGEKKINREMFCMAVFRAVEIYTKNLNNKHRARELLNLVIQRYPDSKESITAEIRIFGRRIDGTDIDSYYEIRIGEDTYADVNQNLIRKWISRGLITKFTLFMNTQTGRWDSLGELQEFKSYWPPTS